MDRIPPPADGRIEPELRKLLDGRRADGLLLLVGGNDLPHFRLRVAQSQVRHNLTPSTWSHVGLLLSEGNDMVVKEVPLDPAGGFRDMPGSNGIHTSPLTRYEDHERFPNVALLRFRVDVERLEEAVERVRLERGVLDLPATILPWLGYVWGAGASANPLVTGTGMPSAVFVEAVFAALGVELTPGLATRSSCPEAIWQAARYWHRFYAERDARASDDAIPSGVYWVRQGYAAIVGPDEGR